uniref:Mediator of RNA polymerase II transcription subunit 4 n=1 Tax=Romanomermis culicivorax TaxID=13658 RepID=A0A915L2M3_ROMCU
MLIIERLKLKQRRMNGQEINKRKEKAKGQMERQIIIDQLNEEVKKRDEYISKIFSCFKESEDVLINTIFQANRKLKVIGEANRRKVTPNELIKYAHKISASNSVAAPLNWQQGDPQRPYPVEVEMWQGWPERLKERTKEKEFGIPSSIGPPPTAMHGIFPGQTTPHQHEFTNRPPPPQAIFPPPAQIPSSPMNPNRFPPWNVSPRMQQQISPRMQRNITPHHLPGPQPQSHIMMTRSPFSQGQPPQTNLGPPMTPQSALLRMETSVPHSVEVLSSDSSSSSDSD